jgi:hypothetical protein
MKKQTIIQTHFHTQYNHKHSLGKTMDSISLAVPDQNLSIRELLEKHSRGLPLGVTEKQGEYFDTEIPRFTDLTDIPKFKQDLLDQEKILTNQIKFEQKQNKLKEESLSQELAPTKLDSSKSE